MTRREPIDLLLKNQFWANQKRRKKDDEPDADSTVDQFMGFVKIIHLEQDHKTIQCIYHHASIACLKSLLDNQEGLKVWNQLLVSVNFTGLKVNPADVDSTAQRIPIKIRN